jgi:hypothetical protein
MEDNTLLSPFQDTKPLEDHTQFSCQELSNVVINGSLGSDPLAYLLRAPGNVTLLNIAIYHCLLVCKNCNDLTLRLHVVGSWVLWRRKIFQISSHEHSQAFTCNNQLSKTGHIKNWVSCSCTTPVLPACCSTVVDPVLQGIIIHQITFIYWLYFTKFQWC